MSTTPRLYQYPIRAAQLMAAHPPAPGAAALPEHPTYPLGTSIAQYLHLLVHTRPGELRSAPSFGCAIWDLEFDNEVNPVRWEATLTASLLAAIQEHEPRLHEVQVKISFAPLSPASLPTKLAAQQQAQVTVTGVVALTGEAFRYSTRLYLGHLAA